MMFYRSPAPGKKLSTSLKSVLQTAGALVILASLFVLNACSGSSMASNPAAGTAASASSAALNIAATLPSATVGSTYSGNLTASGGTAPYVFTLASGALPQGVSLNGTTGAVAGTPSDSGSFPFTVSATDADGRSKEQTLQISVAAAAAGPAVTITVNPGTASVSSGTSTQFAAQVKNSTNTAVTWTATQGSISSAGLYSAPQVSTNTTVTVIAASVADPSQSATASVTVTPESNSGGSAAPNGEKSFSNVQTAGGWGEFGQEGPNYVDCSPSPCKGIQFSMQQGISQPSLSGNATEYFLGGTAPFADALWNNHLIGQDSSQGMPDTDQTLVPSLHNFTYDVYFYGDNLAVSQALEFDLNQFFGNMAFIFGHECRIASGNEWDVWDAQHAQWTPTGIPCYPHSNAWNHLTLQVQRSSNNQITYQSITLNGITNNLNWSFNPGATNSWYGVTVNFQMDGNGQQDAYQVYLDNLTVSYD